MGLFGIKDAGDILVKDIVTKDIVSLIDYANTFEVTLSSDTVYALAKGQNRIAFDQAKEGTIAMTTQLADTGLFAMILGSELLTTTEDVYGQEKGTVVNGKVTLKGTPIADSVSVIVGDTRKVLLTGTSTSDTAVTVVGQDVEFDASFEGKNVVIFYLKANAEVKKFTVKSGNSSKAYEMIAFVEATSDVDNSVRPLQLKFPKVKPKSNISFEFDATNPSEFSLEWDILADSNGTMFDWIEL